MGTLIAASSAAMYYVGALHVLSGKLTVGQIWYLSTLLLMLYQPLEALTQIAWAFQGAAAGATRCFEVLDKENDVPDAPDAKASDRRAGEIVFENVSFGYNSDARDPARCQSAHRARARPSPSSAAPARAKSTLLSLVPRFYDPTPAASCSTATTCAPSPRNPCATRSASSSRTRCSSPRPIRENIAYGRPDATEEEIIEAAKRAQAHEFIMAMPDGYRSQVGERGGHLSVGQRQRLGIARAFLKNAPLLILDEPTSALDPTTEAAIMQTIEELMRGRTTLIITHRIATVHGVDKIVVLAKGKIAETARA